MVATVGDYPPLGGPGGSGITLVSAIGQLINQQLDGTYDNVSWDPRGVGKYTLCVLFT